ncbi:MAG: HesA/MoeB/ThiF family protein [Pseudomonadota bacterium]
MATFPSSLSTSSVCAASTDDRDARHRSLAGFGDDATRRLRVSRVLIIGVGGTGCAAAAALAAAGVGKLALVDFDRVDASNLARQPLYTPADIGRDKVAVAATRLATQHPGIDIVPRAERLMGDALRDAVGDADVALDCSDNFASRFALNEACVATGTALVSGSALRWEGQVAVFGPDYASAPCYRCMYSDDDESLDDCQGAGVLGPIPAVIGALMATEAIKVVTGTGSPARLSLYDGRSGEWRQLSVTKNANCPVCAAR